MCYSESDPSSLPKVLSLDPGSAIYQKQDLRQVTASLSHPLWLHFKNSEEEPYSTVLFIGKDELWAMSPEQVIQEEMEVPPPFFLCVSQGLPR